MAKRKHQLGKPKGSTKAKTHDNQFYEINTAMELEKQLNMDFDNFAENENNDKFSSNQIISKKYNTDLKN